MSQKLINHSPDLTRLKDEGYAIELKHGFALVHDVPYVNAQQEVRFGTLVSDLNLTGDVTTTPNTHVIYFIGMQPCKKDGSVISSIEHGTSINQKLAEGLVVNHSFSNKPPEGYANYYEKFTRNIEILMTPAQSMDHSVDPRTRRVFESHDDQNFHYLDTNSSRVKITTVGDKLRHLKIGIIGLGGTGSYILDFVSKTPVAEIHLYDGDVFSQHNAFRAPGAPSITQLYARNSKVDYFLGIYQNMRKNIFTHSEYLDDTNLDRILAMDFVFIAVDNGAIKRKIIDKLTAHQKPFIDVGIGLQVEEDLLVGDARVTTAIPGKSEHVYDRISFADGGEDAYSTNIQIAELNALNAAMAVIKWKKHYGFYFDYTMANNQVYNIASGDMTNADIFKA
ncbi:ThiF family adenylyltransferase [Paenibacillus sp. B01]|uniref:ThiF family adenylyltransferase n=1 Tax=Paenibacillus sp. B01 TaxID=2660554 RepID=UPI00129BC342|nr:ThiF family adenylyltransferase [Paenibacillus sp. B01]QGG57835.1 ThiF family adenylyltransferase [Paenibacillus sp. B01]